MTNEYLTVPQLMEYLQISKKTAYNLVRSGRIPIYKLSERKTLLKRSDVDAYMSKRKMF